MEKSLPNWLLNIFLLLSMVGVIDSFYLTYSHLSGGEAGCFLVEGCDLVLTSQYSEFLGIPVALFGLIYYLFIFLGFLYYNFRGGEKLSKILLFSTFAGILASLWFVYLQAFVIKAYCSYCLVSALTSILLFILAMYVLKRNKKEDVSIEEDGELMYNRDN